MALRIVKHTPTPSCEEVYYTVEESCWFFFWVPLSCLVQAESTGCTGFMTRHSSLAKAEKHLAQTQVSLLNDTNSRKVRWTREVLK
jgi:hypothetical protein